jgi:hypothetical protein
MSLKALVMAIWSAMHPMAPSLPDAPEIADAIVIAVSQDTAPPVFGSREEDAAVMAYYALRESWLRKHVVGDGGRSFGVWQENSRTGRADVVTQARAWLVLLHEGARICPANPAAPLSGGCQAAGRLAARRVTKALELLELAKRTLAAADRSAPSVPARAVASFPKRGRRAVASNARGRDLQYAIN